MQIAICFSLPILSILLTVPVINSGPIERNQLIKWEALYPVSRNMNYR